MSRLGAIGKKMTTRIKRHLKIWGTNLLGVLCLILVPIIGPLPGPGGLLLISAGLRLLAVNNRWAESLYGWVQKNLTSLSDLIFIETKAWQRAWDGGIYLILGIGIYVMIWLDSLEFAGFKVWFFESDFGFIWQTALSTVLFFFVLAWFRNRHRFKRIVRRFKTWFGAARPAEAQMRAVTLQQPWASLVAGGYKKIETRTWKPPTELVGRRIAVHAGKRLPGRLPQRLEKAAAGRLGKDWRLSLPLGAVVATAELTKVEPASKPGLSKEELLFGDYSAGRWMWRLGDVKVVEPPLPARGYQGFWHLKKPLERR